MFLAAVLLFLAATSVAAQGPGPYRSGATGREHGLPHACRLQMANKITAQRYLEAFEQADTQKLDRLIADDFVNHSAPLPPDKAGFIASDVAFRASFPDGKFTIQSLMAEGDSVALYGHFTGVHSGAPFMGIPAAGATASFDYSLLLRIEKGQIAERWATADDVMGLLIPLGFRLVPPGQ
jgi:predicted ester cyclase